MKVTRTEGRNRAQRERSLYQSMGKPVLDRAVALPLAVVSLPFLILLMLVSRLTYGGSIDLAERTGLNGTTFNLYRLRTTYPHSGDLRGRPLKLGRFLRAWSLDELPQLWNVVFGHMSLVGPRPIPLDETKRLEPWQLRRHEVRPGLTGLWQVEARGDGRVLFDNIHYDIQYIDQISLGTDLRVLAKTAGVFFPRHEGTPASGAPPERLRDRIPHIRLIASDLALWAIALPFAVWVRFDFGWSDTSASRVATSIAGAVILQAMWGKFAGLYQGRRRLASFEETAWVAAGAGVVTAILLVAATLAIPLIARGAIVGAGAFYLLGALSTRYVARVVYTNDRRSTHQRHQRLLVYGAGEAGIGAVKALWMDTASDLEPVAFLDDDVTKHGSRLMGLPVVGGRSDLASASRRYGADSLLVAMPSAQPGDLDSIGDAGRRLGMQVKVMPPLVASLSDLLVEHARSAPESETWYTQSGPAPGRGAERVSTEREYDLAIIGLGYVGLPVAVHASRQGVAVLGLDISKDRVAALNAGTSYVEDVSDADLAEAIGAGFFATTDSAMLTKADAITISVPTPLRDDLPDLRAVIAASTAVGDYLQPGQVVVLESTTYPGTTEEVVKPILEERSGLVAGQDFYLAYSPERIDPGNKEWSIHNTPKLVGGVDEESTARAALLYQKFSPVVAMSGTREAEMAKLLENTYRHVNIALVNELAIFCHQLDVDIWETIRGAATKPFGFQAFYPGPGVGGHCIPIDPTYLSYRVRELGEQFRFIELAREINDFMPSYVASRCRDLLLQHDVDVAGSRILILGVAYKPDLGDTRETPATAVISALRSTGASVEYVDPFVESFEVLGIPVPRRTDLKSAAAEADLVLVHTVHSQFDLDDVSSAATLILDTRGMVKGGPAERL